MTQEIADKLIQWYEESIEMIQKLSSRIDVGDILSDRGLSHGICSCASINFGYYLYTDDWVNSFMAVDGSKWWFGNYTPIDAKTKEKVIDLLQKRVDRLKTFNEPINKLSI